MYSEVVRCPICGKHTLLRIQNGCYLKEYPIRVNCINCRALLRGTFTMSRGSKPMGLFMQNAETKECNPEVVNQTDITFPNVDYVAEVSGELPCKNPREYHGGLPNSPFLEAVDNLRSMPDRMTRLSCFNQKMEEWNRTKSVAFQLLDEGSLDYISKALKNKLGRYNYECDH